jgi:hypothetical protein
LFDWSGKEEIVAEGHWYSSDPKMLVNDIPLGPNAMTVWVDTPKKHEAFLWRPTPDLTCIEDVVGSIVAWPANKVALEKIPESEEVDNASSPMVYIYIYFHIMHYIGYVGELVFNLMLVLY